MIYGKPHDLRSCPCPCNVFRLTWNFQNEFYNANLMFWALWIRNHVYNEVLTWLKPRFKRVLFYTLVVYSDSVCFIASAFTPMFYTLHQVIYTFMTYVGVSRHGFACETFKLWRAYSALAHFKASWTRWSLIKY